MARWTPTAKRNGMPSGSGDVLLGNGVTIDELYAVLTEARKAKPKGDRPNGGGMYVLRNGMPSRNGADEVPPNE